MDVTSLNLTTLLVVALALVSVFFLLRKRYHSNLPLFFYLVTVVFTNVTERTVNPYLLYSGVGLALLLRFEFMNPSFSRAVALCTTCSMFLIGVVFLRQVFGEGLPRF